ncbi:MAG TPA: TlpA disulfide reductase family protein [Bacillota bacterium]|nr:TlpA disulfide reductase family protein [Bacillota bacterium]
MKKYIVLGLILVSLILTVLIGTTGFTAEKAGQAKQTGQVGPGVGLIAPDFTLQDLNGKKYSLKEVVAQNKVTLVNFWATWCPPCRAEIPELIKFYQKYSTKKVALLAINLQENPSEVKNFVVQNKMNFPILADTKGSVAEQYQVYAIPSTIFLDSKGKVRQKIEGSTNLETIEGIVQKLLKEK